MNQPRTLAKSINQHCLCKTLDRSVLLEHLKSSPEIEKLILEKSNLFSETAIYISSDDLEKMKTLIRTIEEVIATPSYQSSVLRETHPVALKDFGPHGVFMGYDFHLTEAGPKLIEINTNAGGLYLNLLLAQAQLACCDGTTPPVDPTDLAEKLFTAFCEEWSSQRKAQPWHVVAIVDEFPEAQYLFPEFKLFAELFRKHGKTVFILDPSELTLRDGSLWYKDQKIDLIYNRSTDFYFEKSSHENLRGAYLAGGVVVTPNPRHHALFAHKENLELLTSESFLLSLDEEQRNTLRAGIPRTIRVLEAKGPELWAKRKNYFFKPTSGFGSKGTYRGDKLTLKVWEEIGKSSYVAQEIAAPGLRMVETDGKQVELKQDIRVYTYHGQILLFASRLYQGQTTNFRTQGGGFAPVFVI